MSAVAVGPAPAPDVAAGLEQMYADLVAAGESSEDAARITDYEVCRRAVARRLRRRGIYREPTEAEIDAAFARM